MEARGKRRNREERCRAKARGVGQGPWGSSERGARLLGRDLPAQSFICAAAGRSERFRPIFFLGADLEAQMVELAHLIWVGAL